MAKTFSLNHDLDDALIVPEQFFDEPHSVVTTDGLSNSQKLSILRRWEHNARQLETAAGEGMTGGESSQLPAVLRAISMVEEA